MAARRSTVILRSPITSPLPPARSYRSRCSSPAPTAVSTRSPSTRRGWRAPRRCGTWGACSTGCAGWKARRRTMAEMDINEVLAHLPQRYPVLMIDRVREYEPHKRIVALKNVSANEPYFQGHFPGRPIMPGVLILEAMAQAAGVLVFSAEGSARKHDEHVYYYVGIDNARFKKPVVPGDELELEVKLERALRGIGKFSCVARVAGTVVAEATILCSVQPANGA